ncbi:MAG: hypothetical protein E6J34_22070 [Chloroflexi bacterium]|nr:MAG: hypothetical protein E6J34_22070 [Chloroflexota bacterium]
MAWWSFGCAAAEEEEELGFEFVDEEASDDELFLVEGAMQGVEVCAVFCAWCEVQIGTSSISGSHGICSDCNSALLAQHAARRSR